MLKLIDEHVTAGKSFAIETTLSGLGYVRLIKKWRALGYYVELLFLELPSAEYAIERVANRVKHGGHFIPYDVVRRRFDAGLKNFHSRYKAIVDSWSHIDNANEQNILIDWSEK